jgi:hypothetical protein
MIQGQTESKNVGSFIKLTKYVCTLDGHGIIGYINPELMACVSMIEQCHSPYLTQSERETQDNIPAFYLLVSFH